MKMGHMETQNEEQTAGAMVLTWGPFNVGLLCL